MPSVEELKEEVDRAQRALITARIHLAEEMWKDVKCHWCDKTNEQNEWDGFGPLIDFTLVTSDGAEGYARVRRYACQEHYEWLHDQLDKLGFTVHVHGGICFLEASCVDNPYENCPTPEEQFE